jgi:hypothetical protein
MIVTEHVCPPVPTAQWDWLAYVEGEEDGATGRGATECEALRDLCEQLATAGDDGGAAAAEIARLRARVLVLEAGHKDASGAVLQERQRWQGSIDVIAGYCGKVGRRDWVSVGAWLNEGDVIAVVPRELRA